MALADPSFTYEARARTTVTASTSEPVTAHAAVPGPRNRLTAALATTTVLVTALAAWGWLSRPPQPEPGVPTRAEVTGLDLVNSSGGWMFTISPDGRWIVAGQGEAGSDPALYIRAADDTEWRRLSNTENATDPTFSPDGQSVAFRVAGTISKVPIAGGPALPIATGRSPHWGSDNTVVFSQGGDLYRVGSSGGEPELMLASDTVDVVRPHLLPNGKGVVFGSVSDAANSRVLIFEIETGEVTGPQVSLLPALTVFGGGASLFAVSEMRA